MINGDHQGEGEVVIGRERLRIGEVVIVRARSTVRGRDRQGVIGRA